jgi:hypothetical protein
MVTAEEIGRVAVFADLEPAERDWRVSLQTRSLPRT